MTFKISKDGFKSLTHIDGIMAMDYIIKARTYVIIIIIIHVIIISITLTLISDYSVIVM